MFILLNIVLSYVAWFAVAMLAASGHFWLAVLPSLAAVAFHIAIVRPQCRWPELLLSFIAIPIGLAVETIHMLAGATSYADGASFMGLPPAYMIGLWMAFATLINTSLGWLKTRLGLAAMVGAVASPLSYFAGAKLGAVMLADPVWQSLAIIGAVWAVAFPVLVVAGRRTSAWSQRRS